MKYLALLALIAALAAYHLTRPGYDWAYDGPYNGGFDTGDFGYADLSPNKDAGYFGGAEVAHD
jgi:hypothetical protein